MSNSAFYSAFLCKIGGTEYDYVLVDHHFLRIKWTFIEFAVFLSSIDSELGHYLPMGQVKFCIQSHESVIGKEK